MSKEVFRQQFAEAKQWYREGRYEESLSRLTEINEMYPDTFNVQYPMLQTLVRLGRFDEATDILNRLQERFADEKFRDKLVKAEQTIAAIQAGSPETNTPAPFDPVDSANDINDEEPAQTSQPSSRYSRLPKPLRALIISTEVVIILTVVFLGMSMFLKKMDYVPEFSADIAVEFHDSKFTGKLYFKNPALNRTELMDNLFLTRGGRVYRLLPDASQYFPTTTSDMERHNPLIGTSDIAAWTARHKAQLVGHERLQGYACDVYEVEKQGDPDSPPILTKVWYAKKLKFPIRNESVLPDEAEGKIVFTLQNISAGDVPDNLFNIPDGYTEVTAPPKVKKSPEEIRELPSNLDPLLEELSPEILLENIKSEK